MRYLLRPFVLTWRYWPQLAACYLVGLVVRQGAIDLAAWAGHDTKVWAALIMPVAGLARLGSYIAMFLVLRSGIPELAALPGRSLRSIDLFSTVIVPFFAIYLAWQLFKEDWLAYETKALEYRVAEAMSHPNTGDVVPDMLPGGLLTATLIGVALVLRFLLSWFSDRLPGWVLPIRVYVDALWVFLALSYSLTQGFTFLINPGSWVAQRRIVVWFNETRADLFADFKPLQVGWETLMWALSTVLGGAAVPLMWLAIAGIVYGATTNIDWHGAVRRVVGARGSTLIDKTVPAERVQRGWQKLPTALRPRVSEYAWSKTGKFKPVVDAARLILHGGLLGLSVYVLAYLVLAWLDRSGSFYGNPVDSGYLFRGSAWLLGPHDFLFWRGFAGTLNLASHLVVEPLRIAVIATMFAFCLHNIGPSQPEPNQDRAVDVGDVDRGRQHSGRQ